MIFHAVKADVPPGVPLIESRKKRIVLTLLKRDEDVEVLKKYKRAGMRRQQIMRLALEAR